MGIAKIDNYILTHGVVIGNRVELENCEVESGTVIEAGCQFFSSASLLPSLTQIR